MKEDVVEEFEELTKDAGRVQKETLERILRENGGVEYLQEHGLDGRTDEKSFRDCIPLVEHSDLEPYIRRIADGDSSPVLTAKPITAISLSSGTSQGKPKIIPFNDELMESTMQIYRTNFAFRNREYPIKRGRALLLIYGSKQSRTKGGLPLGTATTNVYRDDKFKSTMKGIGSEGCSPDEVVFAPHFPDSLYCHLLCALLSCDDIQFVFSTFAHSIVTAFRAFECLWEELCADIRAGVLSRRIASPSVRLAMARRLRPDPELAALVRDRCMGLSDWYGLIPALFPNARYLHGIMTGSMQHYLKKLRHYAGGLPLLCADYGSTEGWIAVNARPRAPPESASFAVVPNFGYFEFIPLSSPSSPPLGLTQVQIGQEYEIVITNFAGMYRYKLGDVVRVTGKKNRTAEVRFVCRRKVILSINIDKNTERDLEAAVEAAAGILEEEEVEITDYTSGEERGGENQAGHYVIYWELKGEAREEVLRRCANRLDQSFAADPGYRSSRAAGAIAPLQLRIVTAGTFLLVMHHFLSMGAAVSQFKTPRSLPPSPSPLSLILSSNLLRSFSSTAAF